MRYSSSSVSLRTFGLAFAVVLSPAFLQQVTCVRGNADLASLELEVDGGPNLIVGFDPVVRNYDVSTSGSTVTVRADALINSSTVNWVWRVGGVAIGGAEIGVDGGEVTLPISIPDGQSELGIAVRVAPSNGTATALYKINIDRVPPVLHSCTEQGIRDAIAAGGGPHYFDCQAPTTVPTGSEIVINNSVWLDGEGKLTVDGRNTHRVFSIGHGVTAWLTGITVTGGDSADCGGGIYNEGTLALADSVVTGNSANRGGGVCNEGTLTATDSTWTLNTAWVGAGIDNHGPATLSNITVSDNHASDSGGGINTRDYGVTLDTSMVSGNTSGVFGGGVHSEGDVILQDTTVSGNTAGAGGGLYMYGGTLLVHRSAVTGNSAQLGGGVMMLQGSLTAINSTVSGNSATTGLGSGGGIHGGEGTLTLYHSTIAANSADLDYTRAIYAGDGLVTLTNTLIEGECSGSSVPVSNGYNIESPGDSCGLTHVTDQPAATAGALALGPLQDNGGPTLTHAPLSNSVAIDVIPEADCRDHTGAPLTADQRGITRPQGTLCDVGAVELNETIGSAWPTATPEEHGFDSDQLAGLVESIDLNDRPIDSLQIVRNGVLILDAYFYPYFGDPPHDVASVTKSVTSTVAGIAIEQGILTGVDQRVMPLFPEAPAVGGKEDIEVEHLLTMSSGLACGEGDIFPMMLSGDWVQYVLGRSMASAPGTTFRYCSPCAHLLSATITRASGQTADEIAQQYLFGPLGIVSANWPTDPQGNSRGGGDLQLHPHDMARIGHLFLNDGMWNGQSVISSDWVAAATAPSALTSSYGYLWWRSSGGFEAVGRGGQSIVVRPADRLVVVLTGRGSAGSGEVMSTVLAAMSDGPLPPNAPAHDRLMTAIANATTPPPTQPVPALPDIAADVSGENYQVGLNQYGIECYSVLFNSPSDVELTVVLPDGSHTIPVGMDGVPRFSAEDIVGFPVGTVGAWETPTKFVAHYDQLGGSTYMRVESEFGSDVNTVETHLVDKTGYFGTQVVQGTRVATCP